MSRVAIVGSRTFTNQAQLNEYLDANIFDGDELVSGGAVGVDTFAQEYAKAHGLVIHIHYPDYEHYERRRAPLIRNEHIVKNADSVIAFYAKGKMYKGGTANTASYARKYGKSLTEIEEA